MGFWQYLKLYDYITLGIVILSVVISLIIGMTFGYNAKCPDSYHDYVKRRNTNLRANWTWYLINIAFVTLNFLCPVIVIYVSLPDHDPSPATKVGKIIFYSALGLLFQILTLLLNPSKTAYGFRVAFELMDEAISSNRPNDGDEVKKELELARKIGEEYITNAMYLTFSLKTNLKEEDKSEKEEFMEIYNKLDMEGKINLKTKAIEELRRLEG